MKLKHNTPEYNTMKTELMSVCGVIRTEDFDPTTAIRNRIDYLKNQLRNTNQKGYVLGISGGVDSTATGMLCQMAVNELRDEGYEAKFIAMRLPAGTQRDEADAQNALNFIKPDRVLTVNIGDAATNLSAQNVFDFEQQDHSLDFAFCDFNKGNLKARLRMAMQYHAAAMYSALVIGTDHNSENACGFYTKFGDGACDLIVLNGMNKTQVRLVAKHLGADEKLWAKPPTADLEELNPGKLDDEGFGFPYYKLDLFLEGKEIDIETEEKIVNQFALTQHKRLPIVSFS